MADLVEWTTRHAEWLPPLIFMARIADVSLGTVRTICVVRGMRGLATAMGFLEVSIWITAVSSVMTHLRDPLNVIAYASGFATGNWVGIWLENRLAIGHQMVRMITRERGRELAERLRGEGHSVTEVIGKGGDGPVELCFTAAARREVPGIVALAVRIDPDVLTTVEDVRSTNLKMYRRVPNKTGWRAVLKKK